MTQLDPKIEEFIKERKKKTKNFELKAWLTNAAKRAGQRSLSSHPCTFSHPSSRNRGKTTSVIESSKRRDDGYLRSGNVVISCDLDSLGNAGALDVDRFLMLRLQDGRTLLEHIECETELCKCLLNIDGEDYKELRKRFLAIKTPSSKLSTNDKIKQVYFPVDEGYHQFSVLTPSRLITEMCNRIDEKRKEAIEVRQLRNANKYSELSFDEFPNLCEINFGGQQPQNISVLNTRRQGKFYLLESLPPTLKKAKVRLPKRSFFKECLWSGKFKDNFAGLHRLLMSDVNNINIRNGIKGIILNIFKHVERQVMLIRNEESGWTQRSQFDNLPTYQKHVLDQKYINLRSNNLESMEKFLKECSRWIAISYKETMRNKALDMHDAEIQYIYQLIANYESM